MLDDDEKSGGGAWLVSYADLMTLLFAAFVVLYGITPSGTTNSVLGVAAQIRESFVEIPDIVAMEQKKDLLKFGRFVSKAFTGDVLKQPSAMRDKRKNDVHVVYDVDKNLVDTLLDEIATDPNGVDYGLRQAMVTEPHEHGFTIKLMGAYFFDPGDFRFTRYGRERFLRLGRLLRTLGRPLRIEGHTDSEKPLKDLTNDALGAMRAANASRLLTAELGISPLAIATVSFGAARPLSDNALAEGRQRNRRVEVKVFYD